MQTDETVSVTIVVAILVAVLEVNTVSVVGTVVIGAAVVEVKVDAFDEVQSGKVGGIVPLSSASISPDPKSSSSRLLSSPPPSESSSALGSSVTLVVGTGVSTTLVEAIGGKVGSVIDPCVRSTVGAPEDTINGKVGGVVAIEAVRVV